MIATITALYVKWIAAVISAKRGDSRRSILPSVRSVVTGVEIYGRYVESFRRVMDPGQSRMSCRSRHPAGRWFPIRSGLGLRCQVCVAGRSTVETPWHVERHALAIPRSKVDHGDHDADVFASIGHACVPEAQIADDQRSLSDGRLERRPQGSTGIEAGLLDPTRGALSVCTFLIVDRGVRVRTQPKLSGSIDRRHINEPHVDDRSEGDGGMRKVGIIVHRLRLIRLDGSIARDEGQRGLATEVGRG